MIYRFFYLRGRQGKEFYDSLFKNTLTHLESKYKLDFLKLTTIHVKYFNRASSICGNVQPTSTVIFCGNTLTLKFKGEFYL